MKTLLGFALALGLMAAGGLAEAKSLRIPATGQPAVAIDVPDAWMSTVDTSGNLIVLDSQPAKVGFSITVAVDSSDLDVLARESMKVASASPPEVVGPKSISGFAGTEYRSTLISGGAIIGLDLVIVRVDASHIASVTMLSFPGATVADTNGARGVAGTIKITR